MVQHFRTKDERFILRVYQLATEAGDMDLEVNKYEVGQAIGLQERGVNAICTLLLQSNFLKKRGDENVSLTKRGEDLAVTLLEEK